MTIVGDCPNCAEPFDFADYMGGLSTVCPACSEAFLVPCAGLDNAPARRVPPPLLTPTIVVSAPTSQQSNVAKGFSMGFGAFFGFIAAWMVVALIFVGLLIGVSALALLK